MSTVKTRCRARVWSIKAGKLTKKRNNQTSDQEYEINCIVSERKEVRAVCALTPCSFSHSTSTSRLGRKKMVIYIFLFCFWELIFSSHESKRCWTVHRDQRINSYSVAIRAKQAELSRPLNIPGTTITSVLSKYRRTGIVETLTRSRRKKSFRNRDRNALKLLVNSKRWLTLQNITAKLNECKTKTFSQKTVQRVLHSEGYKRRLAKKKMVVWEANRKKRVKWCKERRGWTADNYWKKVIFQMKVGSCSVQVTVYTFSVWLWTEGKFMIWGCIC